MLNTAYEINSDDAKLLLMREVPEFGNSTCLQIAKLAYDINFLSHICVQELLVKIWYNKISPDKSFIWVCAKNFEHVYIYNII